MSHERQVDPSLIAWDIPAASEVLRAEPMTMTHPLFGPGTRLTLVEARDPYPARLELYPERLIARYRSSLLQVACGHVTALAPQSDHLQVDAQDEALATNLLIYPDGSATLGQLRRQPLLPLHESRPGDPEPAALDAISTPTSSSQPASSASERQAEQANRVVFTGRLGRGVQVRTTANGRIVGRVPLAVHQGEATVWHTILFFDEAATQAEAQLAKGQLVTIIGYKHLRTVQSRDGSTRQAEEIYAVSVQAGPPPKGNDHP